MDFLFYFVFFIILCIAMDINIRIVTGKDIIWWAKNSKTIQYIEVRQDTYIVFLTKREMDKEVNSCKK